MHIGEEIRRIRKAKKKTLQAVADEAGTDTGNLSRLERGTQGYTEDLIRRIADALEVKLSDLYAAIEEPGQKTTLSNVEPGPALRREVPLISWVQAGQWCNVTDPYPPGIGEKKIPTTANVGENAYALRVRGDSMTNPTGSPSFPEGCLIIVDPSRTPENGSYVICRLDDANEATFKQLVIDGGKRYLKPLNPRYPILEVNAEATICGVIRQMVWDFD